MRINLKLVSLFLGSLLWVYVNLIQSPPTRRTFTEPIEVRNASPLTRVTLKTEKVEITLDGTRRDFIIAGNNVAQPWIDLLNTRPGTVQLPVKVNITPGMSLVSVHPSQVVVQIEQLQEREFEIVPEIIGQPAEGYIAEAPILSHRRVKVEALPQVLDRITGAKVSILLQDVKNSISENARVMLISKDGEIHDQIRINPERVTVDVPVKEGYPTRTVSVATPTFINKLPEGLRLDRDTITPTTVTISGPSRILKQIDEISVLPIDLSTLVASSEIVALLRPPQESVRIIGTPTVSVQVVLSAIPVIRTYTGLPLKIRNSPNQHCMATPSSYTLVLKGMVEDLNMINPPDLVLVLDVRDMKPGSYSVPLTCPPTLPKAIEALELTPSHVKIEISETSPIEQTATQSLPLLSNESGATKTAP